jgi:hypothetical protein
MKKTLLTAALVLVTTQAAAQIPPSKTMATVCSGGSQYCVTDGDGNIIGIFQQQGILNRQIGNQLYFIGYDAYGATVDVTIFWLTADCTGEPYMQSGYIS